MGEIADEILIGTICQECLCYITSDDWPNAEKMVSGYPRFCRDCGGNPECNGAAKKPKKGKHRGKENH